MLELKVTLISKSECLLGIFFDKGEYEILEGQWVPFTRFRIGLLFAIADFTWYQKP
jgi:hypothetical protein